MGWRDLIGKKILCFRGYKTKEYGKDTVALSHILFDDGETFIHLQDQDRYDYHDCCSSARMLSLRKDTKEWQQLYEQKFVVECLPNSDPF